jgi:hypothetical protein
MPFRYRAMQSLQSLPFKKRNSSLDVYILRFITFERRAVSREAGGLDIRWRCSKVARLYPPYEFIAS